MKNFKDAIWKENVTNVVQKIKDKYKFVRLQFHRHKRHYKESGCYIKEHRKHLRKWSILRWFIHHRYRPIEESDMVLYPTQPHLQSFLGGRRRNLPADSFAIFTRLKTNGSMATHDIFLERAIAKCNKAGYTTSVAPEQEFFVVRKMGNSFPRQLTLQLL